MLAVCIHGRHFNGKQPSGLISIFHLRDESSVCVGVGGAYVWDKTPQQDFALKMQEGLMREGNVFAGHYGITCYLYATSLYKRRMGNVLRCCLGTCNRL